MSKNNKDSGTFLILAGVLILVAFSYISAKNIENSSSSNSFYSKDDDLVNAKIEDISLDNGKIVVDTDNDDVYVCVKKTRTKPSKNSLCWKKVENKKADISIYVGKTYYVWLKDSENNISSYVQYNTNTDEIFYE